MTHDLIIGVIGGMGPLATADFLAKLAVATPVSVEQDHLRVLVDSNPKLPDRVDAIAGTGPSPGPMLADMASGLERAGADFLVIACNTAHHFESHVRDAVAIPFVSIIEEACDECVRAHPQVSRVGVLATPGCIASGMYQRALAVRGLNAVVLDTRCEVDFVRAVRAIKLEGIGGDAADTMKRLAQTLVDAGAELVIAGCTEVPLVLHNGALAVPLLDSTLNLARRCVQYAKRLAPIPKPRETQGPTGS